jgi:uncharacterized membrane protein
MSTVTQSPDDTRSPGKRQLILLAVVVLAYAGLSHYSESSPDAKGLAAGLSVGPVVLIAIVLAWRWWGSAMGLALTVIFAGLAYHYWAFIETNFAWSDLAQQVGAYGLVAVSFGRSLTGTRVPLCTEITAKVHGTLTAQESAYTRRATVAWLLFYSGLALAILVLFFTAPLHIWSLFTNFATFGLIALMGLIDHAIRRRVLPRHPSGGLVSILRRALLG